MKFRETEMPPVAATAPFSTLMSRRPELAEEAVERLIMTADEQQITLPNGRRLGYTQFGDPAGLPVLFSHGFPGSRLEAELLDAAARSVGVSLVAPDRPGFGLSDFQPGRTILDWPVDVASLADALGWHRFWLLGGSAGCPYALACAQRLRQRTAGVAIIAGLGPTTEKEAVGQMGTVARLGFFLARRAPFIFNLAYGGLAQLVARYPGLVFHLNKATPPDREVLARPEVRATLRASIQEAFRRGPAGAVHEMALLAGPWGFDLEEVSMPLNVWHGRQDGVVPHAMGERIAEKMANAHLRLVANEGHVSLPVRHGAEILKRLLSTG